jgi:hypothetical protein
VAAGGDEGFLRYAYIVSDGDFVLIVEPDAFADPAVVSYFEVPGEFDSGSRSEDDALAYFCTKEAQCCDSDATRKLEWIGYEK